VNICKIINST